MTIFSSDSNVNLYYLLIFTYIFMFRAENIMVLHANSVPDYDLSEQQILDSIEKEFVS